LVGAALIVVIVEFDFLAQQAFGVNFFECDGVAVLMCLTEGGIASGERGYDPDLYGVAFAGWPFARWPEIVAMSRVKRTNRFMRSSSVALIERDDLKVSTA
jgi:hypothetical protein